MEEKHLNVKKVIGTIFVLIFAFIIIFASAMITRKSTTSKVDKDMELKEANVSENVVQSENNITKNTTEEVTKNESNSNNVVNKISDKTNNKVQTTSKGKLPISNLNSVELIKGIYSSDEKQVYITFDDGPSPNVTPQILKILKEENVPATFFVLGSRVELHPEILKQEYEAGHYIANHGYSHKYSSIYSSTQSVLDEYNRAELAIQTALGNSEFHSYLFRFPGGSSGGPYDSLKKEAKTYLANNGIASTNWNCLTGDSEASGRTKEQLLNRLYETAEGHTSLIILMHDADDKQNTADCLKDIIENYKSQGYVFKNFYEIFQ